MDNNKSLVDLRCSINFNCMRVNPYGVDKVSFASTKVECLLLMNNIFFVDGIFNAEHNWWIHLYESGSGATSYENLGGFSGALMNIQVGTWLFVPTRYV